ncbi:hypothetical protein Golomagni_06670 [Golovinomyces magnicellulatus]|nr:hypothetical protein Golomagni_06670 [Golovinomyces magnicellulatus]
MDVRPATKAGSWYTDDPDELREELEGYLENVPDVIDGNTLPIKDARRREYSRFIFIARDYCRVASRHHTNILDTQSCWIHIFWTMCSLGI